MSPRALTAERLAHLIAAARLFEPTDQGVDSEVTAALRRLALTHDKAAAALLRRLASKHEREAAALARKAARPAPAAKPRRPLAKVGARRKREAPQLKAFREAVLARAKGQCERCGGFYTRLEVHHLRSRARGGKHVPENGRALCPSCHRAVTDHAPSARDWKDWIR